MSANKGAGKTRSEAIVTMNPATKKANNPNAQKSNKNQSTPSSNQNSSSKSDKPDSEIWSSFYTAPGSQKSSAKPPQTGSSSAPNKPEQQSSTKPSSETPSSTDNKTTKMEGAAPAKPVIPLQDRKCLFCPIIQDVKNAVTPVYHDRMWDDEFLVLQPIGPVIDGHILVIPRKHVQDASSWEIFGKTCAMASRVAAKRYPGRDVNIQTNQGLLADQTVPHLHVHVIPRVANDGLTQPWTGQLPGRFNTAKKPVIPDSMKPKFPPKPATATAEGKPVEKK